MFSKASKTTAGTMTSEPKTTLKSGIPSIISADMKIVGSVESAGDIQIDGAIDGDVASRTLTVSDSATVRGSVSAETVRVSGMVKGGINAKSVTLTAPPRWRATSSTRRSRSNRAPVSRASASAWTASASSRRRSR